MGDECRDLFPLALREASRGRGLPNGWLGNVGGGRRQKRADLREIDAHGSFGVRPWYGGDRADETISHCGDRLDVSRLIRLVPQCTTHLSDGRVQGIVNVQQNVSPPDTVGDVPAPYELPAPLDEEQENFQRDPFEPDRPPRSSELKIGRIELESTES